MTNAGHGPESASAGPPAETEVDPRFTMANERTFLAWNRTALALIAAGLGIVQLLPPFPGVPFGRHLVGVPLILLGAVIAVAAYRVSDSSTTAAASAATPAIAADSRRGTTDRGSGSPRRIAVWFRFSSQ